ncbi:MAG TPA: 5'-methylthioadenosine/adenosylhomocysteine nucleosidase [Alphaproteobacteria bacterium]|nr:5'-methylthioadenosine/adenosylhomocysteine nucleosidase [Alphaproteobacteria bacterium]
MQGPLGIIAAIPEELRHLAGDTGETVEIAGYRFRHGTLGDEAAVLVETGIGKVNAALAATLLCREFGCRALLFGGVAGGLDPDLAVGDVVVAGRIVQHDYGALVGERLVTYQPGAFPLPGLDTRHGYELEAGLRRRVADAVELIELPVLPLAVTGGTVRRPRVVLGTVLTGDTFVNCAASRLRLHRDFAAQAVEMEGGAVAQVAERFGRPWLVVRCLSDLAGAESHVDFAAFVAAAAANAATVLRRLAGAVSPP